MIDKLKWMWEILVPTNMKNGLKIGKTRHKDFDAFVREKSDGLTILRSGRGEWVDKDANNVVRENMIPVRFIGSRGDAKSIAKFARTHYKQHTILCYAISSEIITVTEDGLNHVINHT